MQATCSCHTRLCPRHRQTGSWNRKAWSALHGRTFGPNFGVGTHPTLLYIHTARDMNPTRTSIRARRPFCGLNGSGAARADPEGAPARRADVRPPARQHHQSTARCSLACFGKTVMHRKLAVIRRVGAVKEYKRVMKLGSKKRYKRVVCGRQISSCVSWASRRTRRRSARSNFNSRSQLAGRGGRRSVNCARPSWGAEVALGSMWRMLLALQVRSEPDLASQR
jgi:hypothetical protein